MVKIDRIEGEAATGLLRWMFGESSPAVGIWDQRLQVASDVKNARFFLFRAHALQETVAGFLFFQATPKGPAHLLDWRVSDAWMAIDPTPSFRSVADAAIDTGASWVQWNRMEAAGTRPEDSWWQPDFIGDLVHWEKQLCNVDAKHERPMDADLQQRSELGSWLLLLMAAKELTAYLADFVDTMQQHSDFPELDQTIQPEVWIAEQLADYESSWGILAWDTSRSPKEVGGLVLWNLDPKIGWEMRWLGVKPKWRGRGLASLLINQSQEMLGQRHSLQATPPSCAQSACSDWEARSFWVSCDSRNRPMIGLLEKLKFCPVYQSSLLFWWRLHETFLA